MNNENAITPNREIVFAIRYLFYEICPEIDSTDESQ